MKETKINLNSLENVGSIQTNLLPDGCVLSAFNQNVSFHAFDQPINAFVKLPGRYKLPLQIDLTVNVSVPGFYFLLGQGHLSFATRQDNRSIGDILNPDCKKPRSFYNSVALNRNTHVRIIYGLKFMQIVIDEETRYFSKRESYMRAHDFSEKNANGFEIMLAPGKLSRILIKEISVIEYPEDPPAIPIENEIRSARLSITKGVKANFEECISALSDEIKQELLSLNDFLMSQKDLKIKRKIEGDHSGCKITYTSSLGFSYALLISDELLDHFFWWYMVSNYKYNGQYMGRKNDFTNEMLNLADHLSPETAFRLVRCFNPCVSCTNGCKARTAYEFRGEKFTTCHGKLCFGMDLQVFPDIRFLFDVLRQVLAQNLACSG